MTTINQYLKMATDAQGVIDNPASSPSASGLAAHELRIAAATSLRLQREADAAHRATGATHDLHGNRYATQADAVAFFNPE